MSDSQPGIAPSITPPTPAQTVKIREPRTFFTETQSILIQLETVFKTKVICYYTPNGFDINQHHPDIFVEQLGEIGPQPQIHLIVISDGGNSSASYRIASILREYTSHLTIIVPSRCASAATVLALSANKILMSPSGYLTAIDTSLTHPLNPKGIDNRPSPVGVDQIKRILKFLDNEGPAVSENYKEGSYRTLFKYVHPVTIGEIDRISSRTILIATKMMQMHVQDFKDEQQINWIANHLYNDYPEHGFPIMYSEAKDMGLPVEKVPSDLRIPLRNLTKYLDSASLAEVTHYSSGHYHKVEYTNLIETVGRRTVYRTVLDRRLNQITKVWLSENDFSKWVNITAPDTPNGKIVISPLAIPMSNESQPNPEPDPVNLQPTT